MHVHTPSTANSFWVQKIEVADEVKWRHVVVVVTHIVFPFIRPTSGGRYCLGERKRYRICNTDACVESGSTFREIQCNEFNTIPYKGTLYEWEPISTPGSLFVLCSVQLVYEEMNNSLILQLPVYQSSSHVII